MITENLSTLKIHRLTQAQYDRELEAGRIDENALYLTPDEVVSIESGGTGATTAAAALTNLGITATAAELNKLDGVTATTAELNYVDGVTSNVQTQIDDIHTEIDAKMNAVNPSGVGSFNLNRKSGTTVGDYSFTEGYDTTASGHVSHAEGDTTTASGNFSHTEGARTTASGAWSHAEGYWSTASGQHSHAEGYSTIAASNGQHAQGRFNIEDNQNKYAHIVGNGSSSKRANIHTLDWEGNAWFKGDVYVGGIGQDDAKKLAPTTKTTLFSGSPSGLGDIIVSESIYNFDLVIFTLDRSGYLFDVIIDPSQYAGDKTIAMPFYMATGTTTWQHLTIGSNYNGCQFVSSYWKNGSPYTLKNVCGIKFS